MGKTKLNYIAQLYGDFGIPIHSREFLEALLKREELDISTLLIQESKSKFDSLPNRIKLSCGNPIETKTNLIFYYPNIYEQYSFANVNIGYYVFEWTKLPQEYVNIINKVLALVCTPSEWAKNILIQNGVKIPVEVVHGGVDTEYFSPRGAVLHHSAGRKFRFLHVGKAESRKGTDTIIKAFKKAFGDSEDVELVLSIDNIFTSTRSEHFLAKFAIENDINTNNIKPLGFVDDIRNLYFDSDVAVFATKAEGIGLPIVEAMACGLPVITPVHSGITEFASDEILIPLKELKEEEIYDPHFFPEKGKYGVWFSPSEDELALKMIYARNNHQECKKIGARASEWILNNYTWDLAVKQFINIIGA